jgi:hypothetical protein
VASGDFCVNWALEENNGDLDGSQNEWLAALGEMKSWGEKSAISLRCIFHFDLSNQQHDRLRFATER